MTYSMMIGKYKLIFSDTHFKDFRKKPTISVYDADTNSETKIASFNSQETFEWFVEAVVEADRKTENSSEKPNNFDKDINVCSKDCETCKHYKLACELFSEICKYEPTTQTETQNSNLTFEKADEPQTEDFKACVEGLTLLWIYNYVTDDEFHRIDARLKCKGEPQTEQVGVPFGEMDEATFKSHCLNCQRDTADIKCLDCDGNKYFLPYGSKTDCAWK